MPVNAVSSNDRVPVEPLIIRSTPPNLSSVALTAHPHMTEPVNPANLFHFQNHPEKFTHEQFGEIINIDCLTKTSRQPTPGVNQGYQAKAPGGRHYYVKHTNAEHCFAQKAEEDLYNLFWMRRNDHSVVPPHFLGYSKAGNGNLIICSIVSEMNFNLKKLSEIKPEFQEEAHKMLEALELLHRVLGNDDIRQSNVMIEIDGNGKPLRPQVVDLGETVTHLEEIFDVQPYERQPDANAYKPGRLGDRQHTEMELSYLEPFVLYQDQLTTQVVQKKDIYPEILEICMKWYCGSEHTRRNIAALLQARINSLFIEKGKNPIREDDSWLSLQRKNPNRYGNY